MLEFGKKPWNRLLFYSISGSLLTLLCLAGFVFKPEPVQTVADREASLAIYMGTACYDLARTEIDAILEEDSENLFATLNLAFLEKFEGRTQTALEIYQRSLNLLERMPSLRRDILDMISLLAFEGEDYVQAIKVAERKLAEYGENYISRFIISLSSLHLDDDRRFEENMDRAIEWGRMDPLFQLGLKSLYEKRKEPNWIHSRLLQYRAENENPILLGAGI